MLRCAFVVLMIELLPGWALLSCWVQEAGKSLGVRFMRLIHYSVSLKIPIPLSLFRVQKYGDSLQTITGKRCFLFAVYLWKSVT